MTYCDYCERDTKAEQEKYPEIDFSGSLFVPAKYESVGDNLASCDNVFHIASLIEEASAEKNPVIRRCNAYALVNL